MKTVLIVCEDLDVHHSGRVGKPSYIATDVYSYKTRYKKIGDLGIFLMKLNAVPAFCNHTKTGFVPRQNRI